MCSDEIVDFDGVIDTEIVICSDGVSSSHAIHTLIFFSLFLPSSIRHFLVSCSVRWNIWPMAPHHGTSPEQEKENSSGGMADARMLIGKYARINDTVEIAKLFMYSNGIENWRKK